MVQSRWSFVFLCENENGFPKSSNNVVNPAKSTPAHCRTCKKKKSIKFNSLTFRWRCLLLNFMYIFFAKIVMFSLQLRTCLSPLPTRLSGVVDVRSVFLY